MNRFNNAKHAYGMLKNVNPSIEMIIAMDIQMTASMRWEKGFSFDGLTPKTRHRVHSQWSIVDGHHIYDSSVGGPGVMHAVTQRVCVGTGESAWYVTQSTISRHSIRSLRPPRTDALTGQRM